jgi:putative hydrolase
MAQSGTENKTARLSNEAVAQRLDLAAELLERQGANPFRVRAYRTACEVVRGLGRPILDILDEQGPSGLLELRGIGRSLARSIEQLALTGRLGLLERLEGQEDPERLFRTVVGIGPELAHRIHERLGIDALPDLEVAAYDGRLAQVPGIGTKRIRAVRESLAGRFRRRPHIPETAPPPVPDEQPPVRELLDVDREYRQKAKAGRLPRIAPRRFNPRREAWLPILHTIRGARHYTALFSNTARAHELGTVRDWVVIYRDDHDGHGQWTVVTGRFAALRGKRLVRGREHECIDHYRSRDDEARLF